MLSYKKKNIYQENISLLKKKRKKKLSVKYDFIYNSSSAEGVHAKLGTIELDAAGRLGKHQKEKFRGEKFINILLHKKFKTVLDIGAGALGATNFFLKNNKIVDIVEYKNSFYFTKKNSKINKVFFGDFSKIKFSKKYDLIWCSHVLEHQNNPGLFLKKVHNTLKEGGYLCLIVPPRKPFVISGHVNIFNAGILIYRLVLSGFNCRNVKILQYDYNIIIYLKKKSIPHLPNLNFDFGDLKKLKKYFPSELSTSNELEGFNGDIMSLNFSKYEKRLLNWNNIMAK